MKKKIYIENLKCGGCESTIRKSLSSIDGLNSIEIDVEKALLIIDLDAENSLQKVIEKLSQLGYPQIGNSNTVLSKAKSYVSCALGKINN